MKSEVYQSQSEANTRGLGLAIASNLTQGGVLLLHGELGSGKTTFVQGLANGLEVEQAITSPTFTILNTYPARHTAITQLAHSDLYRINSEEHVYSIDLPHFAQDPNTLLVVEWPERLNWQWPNVVGEINFTSG